MDSFFSRYRNQGFLAFLLLAQLMLLGYQVRRPDGGGARLIRQWGLQATVPVGKSSQRAVLGVRRWIADYVALRHVRSDNQALATRVANLELENEQLRERVREMPAAAALLTFRTGLDYSTLPAQVVGSGGAPDSEVIYLDQGERAGLRRNMPVITPDGAVGKLTQILSGSAQVLLITDPDSGVGALLGDSGIHGVLHGLGSGAAELRYVLDDENVPIGAKLVTSGEDQVFPKGLPLGTVVSVSPGPIFERIEVKPAADLSRLEQVLVVTARVPPINEASAAGLTAAEIRQAQLPSIPTAATGVGSATTTVGSAPPPAAAAVPPTSPPERTVSDDGTPPAEGDALANSPPPAVAPSAPVPVSAPTAGTTAGAPGAAPVGAGRGGVAKAPSAANPIHH